MAYIKDTIIGGGGHAGAAGVKVARENLFKFREQLNEYYRSLHLVDQEKYFTTSPDLELTDFSDLTLELLDDLKSLEPFGTGNEEPIFRLKNVQLVNVTRMGSDRNHLRLDLRDKNGKYLKLVAFFAPEKWFTLDPAYDQIEPIIKLTENNFNGVKSVEARLLDLIVLD